MVPSSVFLLLVVTVAVSSVHACFTVTKGDLENGESTYVKLQLSAEQLERRDIVLNLFGAQVIGLKVLVCSPFGSEEVVTPNDVKLSFVNPYLITQRLNNRLLPIQLYVEVKHIGIYRGSPPGLTDGDLVLNLE